MLKEEMVATLLEDVTVNLGHVSELHQLETSKRISSDIWPTYLVIPPDKTFIWIVGLQCG